MAASIDLDETREQTQQEGTQKRSEGERNSGEAKISDWTVRKVILMKMWRYARDRSVRQMIFNNVLMLTMLLLFVWCIEYLILISLPYMLMDGLLSSRQCLRSASRGDLVVPRFSTYIEYRYIYQLWIYMLREEIMSAVCYIEYPILISL